MAGSEWFKCDRWTWGAEFEVKLINF